MVLTQPPKSSTQRKCTELLLSLCAELDRAGIEWCIPHGYSTYPDDVDPADVDLIVRREHLRRVAQAIGRMPGTQLAQLRVHNGGTAIRYDVAAAGDPCPVIFGIDASSDIRDLGVVLFAADEFFSGRRRFKNLFWVPRPSVEFGHYLLKKLGKSALLGGEAIDAGQAARLSKLYGEDPIGCRRQLTKFFPEAEATLIADAAASGRWDPVRAEVDRVRRAAVRKSYRTRPADVVRYWIGDLHRGIQRVRQPPRVAVAFLGLDGAGKSAVIQRTAEALWMLFSDVQRYHVRPSSGTGDTGEPWTECHDDPPRGPILSIAKLALWWLDYWTAYFRNALPFRPLLVLFDRYYDDMLVDPIRYRFGGPQRLARIVGRSLPRPDLMIFLDTPPDVALNRKPGVRLEEAARHRHAYVSLVGRLRGGHVVDASRPLEDVARDVCEIILRYMHERTVQRLGGVRDTRGPVPSL